MITILLALATVAAEPGNKNDTAPAAAAAPVTATAAAPATAKPAAPAERRYCINEALTGSRLSQKICRTRKEWEHAGVDLR